MSLFVLLAIGTPALSQNETQADLASLLFGPEWTVTNEDLVTTTLYATAPEFIRLKQALRQYCGKIKGCYYSEQVQGAFGVMNFNEFRVYVSYDPGVVEITSTALTQKDWKSRQGLAQEHVFDLMARLGYWPHSTIGNGHLNIGLKYFADKPQLLRNFIVDYYNHPGLSIALNTIHENLANAKTFDQMSPEVREKFLEAIRQLDAIPDYDVIDVIQKLAPVLAKDKYVALALKDISTIESGESRILSSSARLEVRALRPQANMRDFLKVIKIFESRVQYLQTLSHSIPLAPPLAVRNGLEAMWQYADYLEKSKLKIKDFASLLPEVWRSMPRSDFAAPLAHDAILNCKNAHAGFVR